MSTNGAAGWGIRGKLIAIFVAIKVLPLLLLGWVAWQQAMDLGDRVGVQATDLADGMRSTMVEAGDMAVADAVEALDLRSREAIERLTTDTARSVASFLYDRDADILTAALLNPSKESYERFLAQRKKSWAEHGPWELKEDKSGWRPANPVMENGTSIKVELKENAKNFHYRRPESLAMKTEKPLYREMTFIGLDGRELVKAGPDGGLFAGLSTVSNRRNTWLKAERYFDHLAALKDGEIYVSEVIGAYRPSKVIGPYTPAAAEKAGIPFAPEKAGYAGKENPVGQRFEGIVRWAAPVVRQGKRIGYVTLALDHAHLMAFTDLVVPTEERYTDISDAATGNYAFMWDREGRNISHPRDYFIVGYDPETGEPAVPWLSQSVYDLWRKSSKPWGEFVKEAPRYLSPGSGSKPSLALKKQGNVGLDCRFLNFAPQCAGWHNLTRNGGSGSFVIYWSGLWKLTTAATIPYFTGRYGQDERGFGFVTIGANVDEFHRAATESGERLKAMIAAQDEKAAMQQEALNDSIARSLASSAKELSSYTLIMVVVVIAIAIWMASFLTGRVTSMITGIQAFKRGDLSARLEVKSKDELGQLSAAFNHMADRLKQVIEEYDAARHRAEQSDRAKSEFLANMSHELRTPLNAILGFSDVMRRETIGALGNSAYREYADDIHHSGKHLLDIINDILDLSRIAAGKGELNEEWMSLAETLRATLRMMRERAEEENLILTSEIDQNLPAMMGDPRRVKQVLINLLSNAIKFTPENGAVTVKATTDENGGLVVSVIDTGIGLSSSAIPTALKPFGQVDASLGRKFEGTGLGLPLSKAFMEMHGGKLWVESAPGQGTTIRLTFPPERTCR